MIICAGLATTSCKKREKKQAEEPDRESNTARDNAWVEETNNDIDYMCKNASELGNYTVAPCATVTGYGTSTITIDFGSSGCTCLDGRKRSGKLIFDFSASTPSTAIYFRNPGFHVKVTSQNYMVDSLAITINNKEIRNTTPASIGTGTNTGGINLTWTVTSNISVVKPNGGGTISWSVPARTIELVNTNGSPQCYNGQTLPIDWRKAIIKINGTASGTNAKGESFTAEAKNLIRDFNCSPSSLVPRRHPFVEGKIDYKPGNRPTRFFDFGKKEDCDLNATVTINGVTYGITLP